MYNVVYTYGLAGTAAKKVWNAWRWMNTPKVPGLTYLVTKARYKKKYPFASASARAKTLGPEFRATAWTPTELGMAGGLVGLGVLAGKKAQQGPSKQYASTALMRPIIRRIPGMKSSVGKGRTLFTSKGPGGVFEVGDQAFQRRARLGEILNRARSAGQRVWSAAGEGARGAAQAGKAGARMTGRIVGRYVTLPAVGPNAFPITVPFVGGVVAGNIAYRKSRTQKVQP